MQHNCKSFSACQWLIIDFSAAEQQITTLQDTLKLPILLTFRAAMTLNQAPNRFPGGPPAIPPLPLLHARRPQRPPPAIPLRQFRSNPTHFADTASQAPESEDSESGHLRSPTSEIGEVRRRPFFSWGSWPWQSDTAKDQLELYLEQFQALDPRIGDLQHDYSQFKNNPSPELFEVFSRLVQLNVFKPRPNQPHIQHSSDQGQNPLQTNSWSGFRSDLKVGEGGVLTVWYGLRLAHDSALSSLANVSSKHDLIHRERQD
jgi:hypothetical protein